MGSHIVAVPNEGVFIGQNHSKLTNVLLLQSKVFFLSHPDVHQHEKTFFGEQLF